MPIDDLTALGQKCGKPEKEKDLTQQELSDLSHVSVKQIAKIEKGQMNPSFLDFEGTGKSTADFSGFFNQSGCFPGR